MSVEYIWRVNRSAFSISATVGVYNENAWPDQPEGERGGTRFGIEANLYCYDRGLGNFDVHVNQGSMQVDHDDGRLKLDVYEQALNVAEVLGAMSRTPGMTMVRLAELASFIPTGVTAERYERVPGHAS